MRFGDTPIEPKKFNWVSSVPQADSLSVVSVAGVFEGFLSLLEITHEVDSYSIKIKLKSRDLTFNRCHFSIPP